VTKCEGSKRRAVEAHIRVEHPAAVRMDDTRRELLLPDTVHETADTARANNAGALARGHS
jgi:hypothetical protein